MSKLLQRFDYRSSGYERPNQDWVCGRLASGNPCQLGPNGDGKCRGMAECAPRKDGERWLCTRTEAGGGRCADGPLPDGTCCNTRPPCAPASSTRRRRGMVTRYAVALVIGLILILGGNGMSREFLISPGPLSSSHSQIDDCARCHVGSERSAFDLAAMMFDPHTEGLDAENCVACHAGRGGLAHSQSAETLAALGEKAAAREESGGPPALLMVANRIGVETRVGADGQVACRSCHTEHRGETAAISVMSNVACQSCHTRSFSAFDDGHPAFEKYPYERRTRIRFDHQSHIGKYFLDATFADIAPASCRSCHLPDDQGKLMLAGSFEQTCAACHAEDITKDPVIVLALPGLDVEGLEEREVLLGEWPEYAEAEEFPAIADVLLAGDEDYVAARERLWDADVDLFDLIDEDDEVLEDVAVVVWSIKGLLFDILVEGPPFIADRLTEASGATMTAAYVRDLSASLHVDVLGMVQRGWFPSLFDEVEAYREGEASEFVVIMDEPEEHEYMASAADWTEGGGWFSEAYALQYRLGGHGDAFVREWIDFATKYADVSPSLALVAETLATEKSPGTCVSCHSIDATETGKLVNWRSRQPAPQVAVFSEFAHSKHFSLIGDKGCKTCHEIDPDAAYRTSFEQSNPDRFTSNFKALDKAICADCHAPEKAGDNCAQCHNYHIGYFPPAAVDTRILVLE
jgi:hypothetical protein